MTTVLTELINIAFVYDEYNWTMYWFVVNFQNSVQLWRAVDKGFEVHVDQLEMGSGMGVVAVCQ
jgi:hypothetical protein